MTDAEAQRNATKTSANANQGVLGPDDAPAGQDAFGRFATEIARFTGKPATFFAAVGLVALWGLAGPFFDFSQSWQLFINTTTTTITALMVFLIQNTQNRDTIALQLKLAALILVLEG